LKRTEAKAKKVWEIFEEISKVPRESRHEEKACEWVIEFAKKHKLAHRSDATGNIIIEVPATAGYEEKEMVVLQSHLDMVCEKGPESEHDFANDAIKLIEEDGWVRADGTTLGADNGIGVAMSLAAAVEEGVVHPKLEILCTVDEETGLTGANGLEAGFVKGRRLLNMDSEDDSFTVGCAGGEQTQIDLAAEWEKCGACGCYELKVSNLRGGHSGIDIDKQRANALKLLGRCLAALDEVVGVKIAEISGGSAHNAIPRDARAKICLAGEQFEKAKGVLEELGGRFKDEFEQTDGDITVTLEGAGSEGCSAMSAEASRRLIDLLMALPFGVNRFSQEFEGVVETSSNVAVITTKKQEGVVSIVTSQRSLKESCLDMVTGMVTAVGRLAGAKVETIGRYPGWDPDPASKVLAVCEEVYTEMRGKKPAVKVIHAGLECGIIGKKFVGMDMVSFGPDIENAHSPQERANVESVDKTWAFFVKLLSKM
jgi:dipeptidase D